MPPADQPSRAGTFSPLRTTELRKFLSEAQLKQLERFCRFTSRRQGATLFRQGDPAHSLFLVTEGTIELRARPPARRAYRTAEVVGAGCTFGDESLFLEGRYLFTARVMEPARLMVLPRETFAELARALPETAIGIVRCAGSCMAELVRRSALLSQAPADVGLHQLLGELAANGDEPPRRSVPIRITHAQLAGILHLSRETVSRMLAKMASKGEVELRRGLIKLRRQ
jgi:CRP/FNR family transcriptional regulator, cyclic AMP receptor protein